MDSKNDLSANIVEWPAIALSIAIRKKRVSCVEVMQAYLAQIEKLNPTYNAIVSRVDSDELFRLAKVADSQISRGGRKGWMHGFPVAVKNLSNALGLETSQGSPIFAGTIASADDLFVERMRSEGAIFIGKSNTPEFGLGSQSYNPVHGTTRNAYKPQLTAGGSSGGAAVALATHMVPVADGSDMMGSLRNPAAFNNVIGFRPSQGRVPNFPNDNHFYSQLGVVGPMARNVEDTIHLLGTLSGPDRRDPLSLRDEVIPYRYFRQPKLAEFKIGWLGDYNGYLPFEPGVISLCERSLEFLNALGVIVEPCQPDFSLEELWQTWLTLRHWGVSAARPLYDNLETRKLLKPEILWEIEGGLDQTARQVQLAGMSRSRWYDALDKLLSRYHVLAIPSAQVFPFSSNIHWPEEIDGKPMDTYHRWMEVVIGGTLAGLPVVNLPVGFDDAGRPMGLQFIGRMGEDVQLLEFALAYEKNTDYLSIRPNL